jgi:hypothetical protein
MLKKIAAGGFVAVMMAAIVIGIVQLAAPTAEAQGRGGGSRALAPHAGAALGVRAHRGRDAAMGPGRSGHRVAADSVGRARAAA